MFSFRKAYKPNLRTWFSVFLSWQTFWCQSETKAECASAWGLQNSCWFRIFSVTTAWFNVIGLLREVIIRTNVSNLGAVRLGRLLNYIEADFAAHKLRCRFIAESQSSALSLFMCALVRSPVWSNTGAKLTFHIPSTDSKGTVKVCVLLPDGSCHGNANITYRSSPSCTGIAPSSTWIRYDYICWRC